MRFKFLQGISLHRIDDPGPILVPNQRIEQPFEPLRTNRFILSCELLPLDPHFIKSVSRPSYYIENNHIFWQDLEIEIYEPITPSSTEIIFNSLRTEQIGLMNHEIIIDMLDPVGDVVLQWSVHGFVKEVNLSRLDYNSDEITTINVIFGVNHAEITL